MSPHRGRRRGRSGLTLVELLATVSVLAILIGLLLPAVQASREAARRARCANNLKQLGIGLHSYASAFDCFPSSMLFSDASASRPGEPTVLGNCFSPFARMLAHLDSSSLFNAINFDHLPDFGPGLSANHTTMTTSLAIFICPSDATSAVEGYGRANYRFSLGTSTMMTIPDGRASGRFVPSGGPFPPGLSARPADFADGLSQTIGLSERLQGDWTRRDFHRGGDYRLRDGEYLRVDADEALAVCRSASSPDAGQESRGGESWFLSGLHFTMFNQCATPNSWDSDCSFVRFNSSVHDRRMIDGVMSASSRHPGGVVVLRMGGEVGFVRDTVASAPWRAAATRSGGEISSGD